GPLRAPAARRGAHARGLRPERGQGPAPAQLPRPPRHVDPDDVGLPPQLRARLRLPLRRARHGPARPRHRRRPLRLAPRLTPMPRLLLALLLLSACVAPDPPAPAPADSLAAAPAAPDTLVLRADGRLAEQPAAPLRVEGACPF